MKFYKKGNMTHKMEFPIYRDCDVYNFDTLIPEVRDKLTENLQDMQQDDDIDTDEEVLCSGISQCQQDLRDLKHFVKAQRHFRAHTNVV